MQVKTKYKQTEIGLIPEDWQDCTIGDLNPFITSGSRGWAEFYSDQGTPFIRVTNLSRSSIYLDLTDLQLVDLPAGENEGTRSQLQNGDLLISITGNYIGKISYVDDSVSKPAYINQHVAVVRFNSQKVDSHFVAYFMSGVNAQRHIRSVTDLGAKLGMSLATIHRIRLALPPLPEQHAIAAALTDVDALVNLLDRLIAKKREIKQATMQQLLTGKTRLPGFSGEWRKKKFCEIAEIDMDNIAASTNANYVFNYISLEDVEVGTLRSYTERSFGTAPSRARRQLIKGDVLISTVRPNLKSHLLFGLNEADWICSTGFSVARCNENLANAQFIFFNLFGDSISKQIESLLIGSNYPAINGRDVKRLEFPLPPLDEQIAIATVLSDLDSDVLTLEQRRDKTILLKQGMMQELLTGRTRLI